MSTSLKHQGGKNAYDFISQMPDDILVKILTLLPIKDAAATTILSPRWRYLWLQLFKLIFDGSESLHRIDSSLWNVERIKFIKQVNNVIQKKQDCSYIQEFRVRFGLNNRLRETIESIDKWLTFAVKKQVEVLELSLTDRDEDLYGDVFNYEFPLRFFETNLLTRPSLNDILVETHLFLKKLVLRKVSVTEAVLAKFLKFSPHLETIIIHHARYLNHVHIGGLNLRLKHFELVATTSVSSIVISDFNLDSFIYKGSEIKLDLARLPVLRVIDLYDGHIKLTNNVFKKIASCFSLQNLSINIADPTKCLKCHSISELPNVKKLRLAIGGSKYDCLEYMGAILFACPNLENFTIKPLGSPVVTRKRKAKGIHNRYKHLKLFKIVGYYGRICDLELVLYFIQSAAALKQIVIDAQPTSSSITKEAARSTTEHQLKSILPLGVELVIV